jgi:hypothetical protein
MSAFGSNFYGGVILGLVVGVPFCMILSIVIANWGIIRTMIKANRK